MVKLKSAGLLVGATLFLLQAKLGFCTQGDIDLLF